MTATSIGQQLREARVRSGLSLREVVARSGGKVGSAATLSLIETGKRHPSLHTLEGVARALDLSVVVGPRKVTVRKEAA